MAGAENHKGEESEQSKARRGVTRKAAQTGNENSVVGQLDRARRARRAQLERIQREGNLTPSRQQKPPQYGPSRQYDDD